VLARSSPEDKYLLVTRLNGGESALPGDQEAWEALHPGKAWAKHKDLLLPGYREEWAAARVGGIGEVVGVTGDGTNDGPALRAAEVMIRQEEESGTEKKGRFPSCVRSSSSARLRLFNFYRACVLLLPPFPFYAAFVCFALCACASLLYSYRWASRWG